MYDYDIIQLGLETKYIGQTFIQFENLKSTHQKAKNISSNCPDGMLVLTESQEDFKIGSNKVWYTLDGDNLFMSLILKAKDNKDYSSEIIQIANAAVVSCLNELDSNINVAIKWPNDILVKNKKISSTFCEYAGKKDNTSIILSIYINIDRNSCNDTNLDTGMLENLEDKINPVNSEIAANTKNVENTVLDTSQDNIIALKEVYSTDFVKEVFISNILNRIEIYYDELLNSNTIDKALEIFKSYNSVVGKFVGVKKNNKKTINVVYVEGINSKGQLKVINNKKEALLLNMNEDIIEWCADDKKA